MTVANGFNNYVFCTYGGEPDPDIIKKFEYDSCFEIVDIQGFSKCITKNISAYEYRYAECLYKSSNNFVVEMPKDYVFSVISSELIEHPRMDQYFIKPKSFSHQSEIRIVWRVPEDTPEVLDIKIPEARKYCRRLNTI